MQIKKLPGGERKDSCLIGGIICTKDVAHREMRTHLTNPRILLLQCAIVYQRVEGRLMSLEPVLMQVNIVIFLILFMNFPIFLKIKKKIVTPKFLKFY